MTAPHEEAIYRCHAGPPWQAAPRLYGVDGYQGPQRTYKQIGKVIGPTRERVRQLEKIVMSQLREFAQEE